MPLAKKNNALIVKGGRIAQDCNCCGNGACCDGAVCSIKSRDECDEAAGKVYKGDGTTCTSGQCPVKCCCINGVGYLKTIAECAAAGGQLKSFACDTGVPSPQSVQLVLDLPVTFSLTGTYFAGTRYYDFRCITGAYSLSRAFFPQGGTSAAYSLFLPKAHIGFQVSTSGTFNTGYTNAFCRCPPAVFRSGQAQCHPDSSYTSSAEPGRAITCSPATATTLGNYQPLFFVPDGQSINQSDGWPVSVPDFCTASFSFSGDVYALGTTVIGRFTVGNPLP